MIILINLPKRKGKNGISRPNNKIPAWDFFPDSLSGDRIRTLKSLQPENCQHLCKYNADISGIQSGLIKS